MCSTGWAIDSDLTLSNGSENGGIALLHRLGDAGKGVMRRLYDWTFEWLNGLYNRILALFLRRRFDLILLMALVGAVTYGVPGQSVSVVESQEEEGRGGSAANVVRKERRKSPLVSVFSALFPFPGVTS